MLIMETVVFLAIFVGAVGADPGHERRILLHSDLDISQALQTLKADSVQMQNKMVQFQHENDQLKRNVSELQSQNSQLQSQNTHLQSQVSRLESSSRGYMGGGRYSDTGAAVNRICLTADSIWDHYDESIESLGKVYGVEYEFGDFSSQPHVDGSGQFFGNNIEDDDAPCAVCHSARSAAMMIPGRTRCYPGWTEEYSGYLVSGYPGHHAATAYICLDRRAEVIVGGGASNDGNVLVLVEGVCGGSLECPPYVQGRELTCVVCTK